MVLKIQMRSLIAAEAHLWQVVQVGCTPPDARAKVHITRLTERRQNYLRAQGGLQLHWELVGSSSQGYSKRMRH